MNFLSNLKTFLLLAFLTGIIYPLVITVFAQVVFHKKANGDFIEEDGKIIGSRLIAQKFESNKYFWPRPSAVDYNPLPSGGSNLAPTSAKLKNLVLQRQSKFKEGQSGIPSELLFASGSGLDPHISLSTAYFQIDRIAEARKFDSQATKVLADLIEKHTIYPFFGIMGNPYVNVLTLNFELDKISYQHETK